MGTGSGQLGSGTAGAGCSGPCRTGGLQHAHAEPEAPGAGQETRNSGGAKRPRQGEQRAPEALVAEYAEHHPREGPEAVGREEPLARRLESPSVAHPRGAHRLAPPAAETGVEMLHQGRIGWTQLAALERPHQHDAAAGAVGFVSGGEIGGAGRQAESTVHARGQRIAHSAPSSATLRHWPGSKLSRRRPTSWPTPSR